MMAMLGMDQQLETKSIQSQALPYSQNGGGSMQDVESLTKVTSKGVYFQCNGDNSCKKVICDLCQQIRVREFELRPQLQVHKLSIERELYRIYGSLSSQSQLQQEYKTSKTLQLLSI